MSNIENLKPESVFSYFKELTTIPHGSRNTKEISDYCVAFAKKEGLDYGQDLMGNVCIKKPASKGYEASSPVILQGHLDMVCEKTADSTFDFEKDGLELEIDGDWLQARGTTLGADNGIAVAFMLALLSDSSIEHPRLECVFTVDEEIGLLGATAFDVSALEGTRMINMDSDEEGVFTVGCAGGLRANCGLDVSYVMRTGNVYEITLKGLEGGHSGIAIDKERANSNVTMGRILNTLDQELFFSLAKLEGGRADNVIPSNTSATIVIEESDKEVFEKAIQELEEVLKMEYQSTDKDLAIVLKDKGEEQVKVLDPRSQSICLYALNIVPNGIVKNSVDIENLVQTSLNFGILKLTEEQMELSFSVRSSVESEKAEVSRRLQQSIEFLGGTYETVGNYPGWQFKKNSKLQGVMETVYEKQYGKAPEVLAIHAGLECGLFTGRISDLECISMGPTMEQIHTTRERLSISSTERVWKFLLEVLKNLK